MKLPLARLTSNLVPFGAASRVVLSSETRIRMAISNHDRTLVVWRACEREGPRYIRAPDERVCKNKIGVRPGTKFVLATVGQELECHGISCNSPPVHQLHLDGHDLSLDMPFLRPHANRTRNLNVEKEAERTSARR